MSTITTTKFLDPGQRVAGPNLAKPKYTWPKTPFDALPVPGGRRVGDVDNLASLLVALEIPGVSHSEGREFNASMYAEHLERIAKAAGEKAIAEWVASQAVANG